MTVSFNAVAGRVNDALESGGYRVELFDAIGNRVYSAETARKFFANPDGIMVTIHEAGDEDSEMNVALSDGVNIEGFERNVGKRLRIIAARHGQNMSYNIRSYGHQLTPKDFASQVNEDLKMNDTIAEGVRARMTGTTRSSYQKVGECRVIVRHSARVNEDKRGARSRNIDAIFVETKNGERFKVAENNIHGARSLARHLSNGGSPFDTVGMKITGIMEQMAQLNDMMKDARLLGRQGLEEQSGDLVCKIGGHYRSLRESLKKMSGPVGYFRHLGEDIELDEFQSSPRVDAWIELVLGKGFKKIGGGPVGSDIRFKNRTGQYQIRLRLHHSGNEVIDWAIDDMKDNSPDALLTGTTQDELVKGIQQLSGGPVADKPAGFAKTTFGRRTEGEINEYHDNPPDPGEWGDTVEAFGFSRMSGGPVGSDFKYTSPDRNYEVRLRLHPMGHIIGWVLDDLTDVGDDPIATGRDQASLRQALTRTQQGSQTRNSPQSASGFGRKVFGRRKIEAVQEDADPLEGKITVTKQERVDDKGCSIPGAKPTTAENVDKKALKAAGKAREDQIPEYDRPIGKGAKPLDGADASQLNSENYFEENLPEARLLESWFDAASKVEFFRDDELMFEDDVPSIKKILPETALHTLNMYVGHPLFDHYINLYKNQEILDSVMEMVEEGSTLYNAITETNSKLGSGELVLEYAYDPVIIDNAIEKLRGLVSNRRMSLQDAINQISCEIADHEFNGDEEMKGMIADELMSRAEEEGLAKHDAGSTFADAVLSPNEEVERHKEEIEAEQHYGQAQFSEDEETQESEEPIEEDLGEEQSYADWEDEAARRLVSAANADEHETIEEELMRELIDRWHMSIDDAHRAIEAMEVKMLDVDDLNDFDDSMDGDHGSAMASVGWGSDEDYGFYGESVDRLLNLAGLKAEKVVEEVNKRAARTEKELTEESVIAQPKDFDIDAAYKTVERSVAGYFSKNTGLVEELNEADDDKLSAIVEQIEDEALAAAFEDVRSYHEGTVDEFIDEDVVNQIFKRAFKEALSQINEKRGSVRKMTDEEVQAIWSAPTLEAKKALALQTIETFHFVDQASRTLETNKINSFVRPEDVDRWAANMLLHGERMGHGTGRFKKPGWESIEPQAENSLPEEATRIVNIAQYRTSR